MLDVCVCDDGTIRLGIMPSIPYAVCVRVRMSIVYTTYYTLYA